MILGAAVAAELAGVAIEAAAGVVSPIIATARGRLEGL